MFCKNCGKPTEGDQLLCAECAAQQTAPLQEELTVQPQEEVTVQPAEDITAQDTFELDTPAPKKPAKKVGLIAGIAALVVVVAAAIGIAFNMDSIKAFFGRTFSQPDAYLEQVASDAFAVRADELTEVYGQALESSTSTTQDAAKVEVHLLLGDDLLSAFEMMLAQQGMEMDLDWLSDIMLTLDANAQDDAMQMDVGLGLGKKEALSADMIFDLAEMVVYLTVPELNETYLSVDMSEMMASENMMDVMTQSQDAMDELLKELPSEEALNKMLKNYVQIVLAEIDDVEKETDTIEIDGNSQKVVILTAKITEKDIYTIAEKVLKEAQDDKTLKELLVALGDYINTVNSIQNPYYEPMDLYEEFSEAIPDALDELEYSKEDASTKNYIQVKTYVDMKGSIRGFKATPYADGEKSDESISYLTVVKGDTTYTEADLAGIQLTGESTEKKGVSEGFYTLTMEDMEVLTLEFKNVTETSGTLRLIPSEEVMVAFLSESGLPASMLGDKLALELSYNSNDTAASMELLVLNGKETLIGLTLSTEAYDGGKISIPDDALDANSSDDAMEWVSNMDIEGALEKLEDAGVDSQIIEMLETYAEYYLAG